MEGYCSLFLYDMENQTLNDIIITLSPRYQLEGGVFLAIHSRIRCHGYGRGSSPLSLQMV